MRQINTFLMLFLLIGSDAAYAYLGPGLGVGTIGVILAVVASIVLALIGMVWYPIKRLFKRRLKTRGK